MTLSRGLSYILARLLVCAGQLIFIRLLTTYLDPADIGRYYLFISLAALPSLFVITPVLTYVTRHYYKWYERGIGWGKYLTILLFIATVSIISWALAILTMSIGLLPAVFIDLYYLVPIYLFITIVSSYSQELLNLIGKANLFLSLNICELWTKIFFLFVLGNIFNIGTVEVLGAIIISAIIYSLLAAFFLKKTTSSQGIEATNFTFKFEIEKIKDLANFAWPFSIGAIFYWCQSDGYRFALTYVTDIEFAGKFMVGFGLGVALMTAFDVFFHQIYLPLYYKEIAEGTTLSYRIAWNKYAEKIISVFIPLSLYLIFSAPFLARFFLDFKYWDVWIFIIFGVISQLFRILSGALVNGLIATKKTKDLIVPNLFGAVIALGLTYFLASILPIYGVGLSLVISYAVVCFLLYLKLLNGLEIKFPKKIFIKSIIIVSPICIAINLLSQYEIGTNTLQSALVLSLSGFGLLLTQWILSRDIWFKA
jgi:O-antigen/teichoic acid export membrane protein